MNVSCKKMSYFLIFFVTASGATMLVDALCNLAQHTSLAQ